MAGMRLLHVGWREAWVLLGCFCVLLTVYVTHTIPTFNFSLTQSGNTHPEDLRLILPTDKEVKTGRAPWWDGGSGCKCEGPECQTQHDAALGSAQGDVGGTCGRRAWAVGKGQRVVALSLYGNISDYWDGLDEIVRKVEEVYPGWVVRLYTDPRGQAPVLCPLLHRYHLLYICDVTRLPPPLGSLRHIHPMMWRVAPLGDPQVAALMVRDSDSQVNEREVAAVREWLASKREFHLMRDHPSHDMPVMGGMWGARWDQDPALTVKKARELAAFRNKMFRLATGQIDHGIDQHILKAVLYPAMVGRVMAHDSYCCMLFKDTSPWPTQRSQGGFFVGSPRYRKKPIAIVPKTCPVRCRPRDHKDWLYC